jgi:hypothetical protein
VVSQRSTRLSDPSPFKKVSYDQFHTQKVHKQAQTMKASYTNAPFTLQKPMRSFAGTSPRASAPSSLLPPVSSPNSRSSPHLTVSLEPETDTLQEEEEPDEDEDNEESATTADDS